MPVEEETDTTGIFLHLKSQWSIKICELQDLSGTQRLVVGVDEVGANSR